MYSITPYSFFYFSAFPYHLFQYLSSLLLLLPPSSIPNKYTYVTGDVFEISCIPVDPGGKKRKRREEKRRESYGANEIGLGRGGGLLVKLSLGSLHSGPRFLLICVCFLVHIVGWGVCFLSVGGQVRWERAWGGRAGGRDSNKGNFATGELRAFSHA